MSEPITRIIFRRGLDSERKQIVLNQGEPGFAVDTNRLFVGDGQTSGGVSIGTRFLGFTTFGTTNSFVDPFKGALSGDFVFDFGTTLLYVLTGNDFAKTNNYAPLGTSYSVVGSNTISAPGNILEVKENSLDFTYFNSSAVGQGLEIEPATTIRLSTPSPELSFVNNKLGIADNGVTNEKLNLMPPDSVKGRLTTAGTPQDIPITVLANYFAAAGASVPPGTILDFAGETPPNGFLACDGSAVSRTNYSTLFNVIGTIWGAGDGSTTFNLPNLERRTTVGAGGAGTTRLGNTVGSLGGNETHTLTVSELPSHTHTVNAALIAEPREVNVRGGTPAAPLRNTGITSSAAGSNAPHNNLQPSAVVFKIIKF